MHPARKRALRRRQLQQSRSIRGIAGGGNLSYRLNDAHAVSAAEGSDPTRLDLVALHKRSDWTPTTEVRAVLNFTDPYTGRRQSDMKEDYPQILHIRKVERAIASK